VIPGSNLFLRASKLISRNPINYWPYLSRVKNASRQWVSTFGPVQVIYASVQAVSRDTYVQLGLDFQRNYVTVFAAINVVDLVRDSSGDQFVFDGKIYQIESQNTWFLRDGWAECMAVEIGIGTHPMLVSSGP
jgi:hypothetical protein